MHLVTLVLVALAWTTHGTVRVHTADTVVSGPIEARLVEFGMVHVSVSSKSFCAVIPVLI